VSTPVLTVPAPGWYPDPAGAAAFRWWDGTTWTEGTHPGGGQTGVVPEQLFAEVLPQPVAPAAPASAAPAVRRNLQPSKTRWSSLLAAFPVVYPLVVGMSAGIAYAGGAAASMPTVIGVAVAVAVLALIPAWAFAANDRRELLERGYEPAPALAWMLLAPPFAYLIARRRVVGP
jgi:hypothetical protein